MGTNAKPYENALVVEFGLRKIPFRQQLSFDVLYKGHKVGVFVPDLIAFDSVVVDTIGDRANLRSRTWVDVELSTHHGGACWRNPQL